MMQKKYNNQVTVDLQCDLTMVQNIDYEGRNIIYYNNKTL